MNYILTALQNEALRNKLMPLDRLSHRYSSKATPPVETPPINPLTAPKLLPTPSFGRDSSASPMSPTPAAINGVKKNGMNGTQPLTLSNDNSADLHLLTHAEQQLCQSLKIKAKPYMCIKERLITEAIKHGGILKEKAARDICRVFAFPLTVLGVARLMKR
jgi:transcriptional adapter 2-alpha